MQSFSVYWDVDHHRTVNESGGYVTEKIMEPEETSKWKQMANTIGTHRRIRLILISQVEGYIEETLGRILRKLEA